MDKFLTL